MSGPKADRLQLVQATHLNASPIWVMYREPNSALEAAWRSVEPREPEYTFTWREEQHRLWVLDDATVQAIEAEFARWRAPLHCRRPPSLRDGAGL